MKKIAITALLLISSIISLKTYAFLNFSQALMSCEKYSKEGTVQYKNETFNLLITLNKSKNKCIYKEKIYQNTNYQMLTCNFEKSQLDFLSKSMEEYNRTFKKEVTKNPIYEAKMTSNGQIFQKYLIDPKYCKITHSKK